MLFVIALLVVCVPAISGEWYQGGTLHGATVREWKNATYQNKLATCGDMVANLWLKGLTNFEINNPPDDFKPYAQELVVFIDTATEGIDAVNTYKVSELAAMGAVMMGWSKQTGTASQPAQKPGLFDSVYDVEKMLKNNGFLLDEEIDEIWENEITPDILTKLSSAQKKAIVAEFRKAQNESEKSSRTFGASIKDKSSRSMYQDGVCKNKVLKATRAIAKKYGIKAGDVVKIADESN